MSTTAISNEVNSDPRNGAAVGVMRRRHSATTSRTEHCRRVMLFIILLGTANFALAQERPRVAVDTGPLEGVVDQGIDVFRGIPYAEPPVGEWRWRPPRPAADWRGVRDASEFGHVCPQPTKKYPTWADEFIAGVGVDEDCLTLNVWTPADRGDEPLPVMFYIHGGNFQYGAGSFPLYDGRVLASQGVVLVTINYRLGYLGRFAHPAMTRVQAGEPLANYGIFDQIAALEWVQRNIAAFGGDPDNVTIFGHSAGGVSVNTLMTTPQTDGLFEHAIAQGSGILLDGTADAFEPGIPGPSERSREEIGEDFAVHFGIEGESDDVIVRELRALSWPAIIEYQASMQIPFNPVVDGMVVVDDIPRVFERGEQHNVPYIGGANSWEWNQIADIPLVGKWFLAGALLDGLSDEDLAMFDDQWTRIGVSQRWFAEGLFLSSTRYLGKQMANVSAPAWLYRITWVPASVRGEVPGAPHGVELPFLFGTARAHPEFQRPPEAALHEPTAADLAWGDRIRAYWLNFAKTGNPNGPGLPEWPVYDPDTDLTMVLGVDAAPEAELNKDTLDQLEERAMIRRRAFESGR